MADLSFNPNAPEQKPTVQPEWATYVPFAYGKRGTKFKTHSKLHHATTALDWSNEGMLYHWDGTEWVELVRKERDKINGKSTDIQADDKCFFCGRTMRETTEQYSQPRWVWKREHERIANPPEMVKACPSCKSRK